MGSIGFLDPCPDSVWAQLPGGPEAWNDTFAEAWQYLGTVFDNDDEFRHEFRHRAHPLYRDHRVYAHVLDGEAGPRLERLLGVLDGDELASHDPDPGQGRGGG
jgi:hypothetical protein